MPPLSVFIHWTVLSNSVLIGWKHTVNFRNRRLWRHNYRLYNNHVNDTRGHGLSCQVRALCVVSRQWRSKNMTSIFFRSMCNKTIIRFSFCDIQNNQGLGKDQPLADSSYLDLDYFVYHKNLVQWLFICFLNSTRSVSGGLRRVSFNSPVYHSKTNKLLG